MQIVDFGLLAYEKTDAMLESYIQKTVLLKENYLLLGSHYPVFTVGSQRDYEAYPTDRGGSITYHDEGCLMGYFSFLVPSPPRFYAQVLSALHTFFSNFTSQIFYDKKRPGFYVENRKIASLGFRYKNGVSKHGVSIHLDPDLNRFNTIKPCGLKGIKATSLHSEGFDITMEEAKKLFIKAVKDVFEA